MFFIFHTVFKHYFFQHGTKSFKRLLETIFSDDMLSIYIYIFYKLFILINKRACHFAAVFLHFRTFRTIYSACIVLKNIISCIICCAVIDSYAHFNIICIVYISVWGWAIIKLNSSQVSTFLTPNL